MYDSFFLVSDASGGNLLPSLTPPIAALKLDHLRGIRTWRLPRPGGRVMDGSCRTLEVVKQPNRAMIHEINGLRMNMKELYIKHGV